MTAPERRKAVIYCRVASTLAETRSDAFVSQETLCREYAGSRGYEVVEMFCDISSGANATRPGLNEMLAFLGKQRPERYVVIVDDISRLARGVEVFVQLRTAFRDAGADLESPTFAFEQSPGGVFAETLLASLAQYREERDENIKSEDAPHQIRWLSKPYERKR